MQASNHLVRSDSRVIGSVPWANSFTNVESSGRDIVKVMKEANLDYSFHKEQLTLPDGRPVNNYAIVRDDNKEILSHSIGSEWTGLSNINRFKWFEPFLLNKDATIIHAGQITDSTTTKICVIARLDHNTNVEIQKGDEVAKYILLSDSFGKSSLRPMLLITRLLCGNGMLSTSQEMIQSIRHSKHIEAKVNLAHDNIALWNAGFEDNVKQYRQLASVDIKNETNLENYFKDVMEFKPKDGETELGTRQQNTLERLVDLFEDKTYNSGHSLWTAFNIVTAMLNHVSGRTTETALNSLFYGQSRLRQTRAMDVAIEYASKI